MLKSDFDFELPPGLIASYPSGQRTDCRLLCLDGEGAVTDRRFGDLAALLRPGDLLVFNDTRVIPARLYGTKESGGKTELLIERITSPRGALAHIRASKTPRAGSVIETEGGYRLRVEGRSADLFEVSCLDDIDLLDLLEKAGHVPLPPYIQRPDEPLDRERYQTVYARYPGAVAAPTAGLHFDASQIEALEGMGVETEYITLHVGAGTFQPVREEDISLHRMHSEHVRISRECADHVAAVRSKGGRVVAVGTTAVRSLESAACKAKSEGLAGICAYDADTSIFIYPGYEFRAVDALITNFHLPQSTLIMLVAAFAGYSRTMDAYRHAVREGYRFFSYGDAMFISKNEKAGEDLPPSARGEG